MAPADESPTAATITRYTSSADLPQQLRVDELAAWLDVSRGYGYELARVHGVRIGRYLRVPRDVAIRLQTEGWHAPGR